VQTAQLRIPIVKLQRPMPRTSIQTKRDAIIPQPRTSLRALLHPSLLSPNGTAYVSQHGTETLCALARMNLILKRHIAAYVRAYLHQRVNARGGVIMTSTSARRGLGTGASAIGLLAQPVLSVLREGSF